MRREAIGLSFRVPADQMFLGRALKIGRQRVIGPEAVQRNAARLAPRAALVRWGSEEGRKETISKRGQYCPPPARLAAFPHAST